MNVNLPFLERFTFVDSGPISASRTGGFFGYSLYVVEFPWRDRMGISGFSFPNLIAEVDTPTSSRFVSEFKRFVDQLGSFGSTWFGLESAMDRDIPLTNLSAIRSIIRFMNPLQCCFIP
jgi:hypothetical protein